MFIQKNEMLWRSFRWVQPGNGSECKLDMQNGCEMFLRKKQSDINTTKATSYNIMGLSDILGFASKSLSNSQSYSWSCLKDHALEQKPFPAFRTWICYIIGLGRNREHNWQATKFWRIAIGENVSCTVWIAIYHYGDHGLIVVQLLPAPSPSSIFNLMTMPLCLLIPKSKCFNMS